MAAVVILGGGGLVVMGLNSDNDSGGGGGGVLPSSQKVGDSKTAAAAPTGPSAADLAKAERAKRVKQLNAALKKLAGPTPDFSVAVYDAKAGATYSYRGTVKFDTASIVKAQILACMLLKAQDAGRKPSSSEMALATPMIQLSDNDATTSLFTRLGGRSAVTRTNTRLGLTHTAVNSSWGLTRTTGADQLKLLSKLVDKSSPLNATSRKTAFTLMNTVSDGQDWGVPSVAQAGETTTVKNGWDTRSADGGLWAINTIGRITAADGHVNVSMAVLSHNNASMEDGMALVEKIAKLTRQYLKY